MRLLLDTHTFIWWDGNPSQLSPHALALCQDRANTLFLSTASIWEMQIKIQLGRLGLHLPLRTVINSQRANGIQLLSIELDHIMMLAELPRHHGDPFDRMLLAQASTEEMSIISRDRVFREYPVRVLW